jgi:large subunit ribosomal protein L4
MKLKVLKQNGQESGDIELGFSIIEEDAKGAQAVHDVVTAYRAAQRSGTACTKTRAEVKAHKKKPWRQKGTGRARAGTTASPIWRGGGVVFGPKPRDYSKKVNKTTRKLALKKALSERIKAGDTILVDNIHFEAPKTKTAVDFLKSIGAQGSVLVITDGVNENLLLSARNLPDVDINTADLFTTYETLRYDTLVITSGAMETIQRRVQP